MHVDGTRSVLLSILKNGAVSTLAIIQGIKDKLAEIKPGCPMQLKIALLGDQSVFVRSRDPTSCTRAFIAAALTGVMILLFLGSWRARSSSPSRFRSRFWRRSRSLSALGETHEHHDARRPGARGRHPRR